MSFDPTGLPDLSGQTVAILGGITPYLAHHPTTAPIMNLGT